ncbi:MAG: nitroreductase family protein [Clostridia bacterium]|nr:nitroreductase family protein [Clostridia bacterium]
MMDSLVLRNRSCRSFDEGTPITKEILTDLVDLARRTASGMNKQPLRYRILSDSSEIAAMLQNCRFGSALPGVKLPPENGKPTGFILIFTDKEAASPESLALKDVGIAAQTILLAATELGFGGCMLGSFEPTRLNADFGISSRYVPQLAIALGKPAERALLTDAHDGSLRYYRDAAGNHCVPKRALDEVLI